MPKITISLIVIAFAFYLLGAKFPVLANKVGLV